MPITTALQVRLRKGSGNAKLTGGRRLADVWIADPVTDDEDRNPYGGCPDTCSMLPRSEAEGRGLDVATLPAWTGGCYTTGRVAASGRSAPHMPLWSLVDEVASETPRLVRFAETGDYGRTDEQWQETASMLLQVKKHVPTITYTHAWHGRQAPDPTFNASCDSADEVEAARALGWQPTLVGPADTEQSRALAKSVRGIVCPAADERSSVRGCVGCGGDSGPLCAADRGGAVVVFPAHGAGKRKITDRVVSDAEAVLRAAGL